LNAIDEILTLNFGILLGGVLYYQQIHDCLFNVELGFFAVLFIGYLIITAKYGHSEVVDERKLQIKYLASHRTLKAFISAIAFYSFLNGLFNFHNYYLHVRDVFLIIWVIYLAFYLYYFKKYTWVILMELKDKIKLILAIDLLAVL